MQKYDFNPGHSHAQFLQRAKGGHLQFPSGSSLLLSGEQGWRSGKSTRLPPMWPRFHSWTGRHWWIEFVVSSRCCSERFFSGYAGFPLSLKTNIPNSNLIWIQWMKNHLVDVPLLIPIYLFIKSEKNFRQCSSIN